MVTSLMVQWGEHVTVDPGVPGSNPINVQYFKNKLLCLFQNALWRENQWSITAEQWNQ